MSMKLHGLHPEVRQRAEWAREAANYFRVPVEITSGFRSLDLQAALRARYEECLARGAFPWAPGCQYPANRPGDSAHNFGLAWDSTTEPAYQNWWNYVRRLLGFRVLEHDLIHAEVPNWRQYVQ